ncbi:MAG: helix-turn-helix domain-containing protein [Hyphomonadaceae bacterium]|nr:helix-turn-helix domain-containing protein [Hyphomonadaceae bacterium]
MTAPARGWSQEELADRAGLHRTYISAVERAVRNPTLTVIARIAKALKVSMAELFN